MDWSLIERIVRNLGELSYRGRISWFWINEPLLDRRMPDIVRLTRTQNPEAFLSLVTNGDMLTAESYDALKRAGLDGLGVSVYDDDTFEKVTPLVDERLAIMDMRSVGPGRLDNRGGNIKQRPAEFERYRRRSSSRSCARPFNMMTINARGQAVLCCSDMYSDVVMGDVRSQRLEDIWNNAAFERYRRALDTNGREGLKLCGECSFPGDASPVRYPLG
jgi:radical SAM protein with 4Fe4S-binding SPASM domain